MCQRYNHGKCLDIFFNKTDIFILKLVKCLRMRIKKLYLTSAMHLSSDITHNTIIFILTHLGLRLVVLLKIMVSPVLCQMIDARQLLKTIPSFSNSIIVCSIHGDLDLLSGSQFVPNSFPQCHGYIAQQRRWINLQTLSTVMRYIHCTVERNLK